MKLIKLIATPHVRFMAWKHAVSTWFKHVQACGIHQGKISTLYRMMALA